jgi:hypothetical protein
MREAVLRTLAFMAALGGAACASHADDVCQDIGDCSQGGSNTWISGCQSEAKSLNQEADDGGCGQAFEGYFSCADSNYSCQGATALFPGCDDLLTALDSCLEAAMAATSCGRLVEAQRGCSGPDAGSPSQLPPACTALRACEAHCYLTDVSDICAPRVDELESFTTCSSQCPP